ncbi:MAG: hypothetical protein JKX85_05100 [Phycisphaeraceae bacterium]|nr:hypothetical protein [Phycisphaeraceae bacterium]
MAEPKIQTPVKPENHIQQLKQTDGGYLLAFDDDVQGETQEDLASDGGIKPPQETPKRSPQPPSSSQTDSPAVLPPLPDSIQDNDNADLLVLDLDLVRSEEDAQSPPPELHEKPSKLKHAPESSFSKTRFIPSDDSNVLPMPGEVKTPKAEPVAKDIPTANLSNDTLAGLEDEEDQLDLAMAEEVVDLTADSVDDDLDDASGGLVVTDAADDDTFDLDYKIKPEETAPIVGLNMLQQQVGRLSSWDRVPVPELAGASDQSSVYELSVDPEEVAEKVCPSCNASMSFDTVVCSTCGYSIQLGRHVDGLDSEPTRDRFDRPERFVLESAKYEEDQEYYHRQHLFNDVYFPTVVLLAMLVFLVFTVMVISPKEMVNRDIVEAVIPSKVVAVVPAAPNAGLNAPGMGGVAASFMTGFASPLPLPPLTIQQRWFCIAYLFGTNLLKIAIKIPFIFIGMLLVARLFGVSFGGVVTAITKMLAIAMAAHVITFFIESILFIITEGLPLMGLGVYVSFPFTVFTFVSLTMRFFELDIQEAIVMYLASYLLPVFAAMFMLMWVVTALT